MGEYGHSSVFKLKVGFLILYVKTLTFVVKPFFYFLSKIRICVLVFGRLHAQIKDIGTKSKKYSTDLKIDTSLNSTAFDWLLFIDTKYHMSIFKCKGLMPPFFKPGFAKTRNGTEWNIHIKVLRIWQFK